MAKFTPKEMKTSLKEGLSLLEKGDKFIWAEFHEIESACQRGFVIVNPEKRSYFEKNRLN